MTFFIYNSSSVEQFAVLPIIPLFNLLSINNVTILYLLILSSLIYSLFLLSKNFKNSSGFYIIKIDAVLTMFGYLRLIKQFIKNKTFTFYFLLVFIFRFCNFRLDRTPTGRIFLYFN